MVLSNIFHVHPYLGKISNLTVAYFSDGWGKTHQPDCVCKKQHLKPREKHLPSSNKVDPMQRKGLPKMHPNQKKSIPKVAHPKKTNMELQKMKVWKMDMFPLKKDGPFCRGYVYFPLGGDMFQNKLLFFPTFGAKIVGSFFVIEKLQTQVTMGRTALRRKEAFFFLLGGGCLRKIFVGRIFISTLKLGKMIQFDVHILGLPPTQDAIVTTRIVTFLVGNPYKPSLATVTGWGVDPIHIFFF